ncbi:DUF1145 domain-containing protein [Pseudomonas sp. SH1-B]
MKSLLTVGKALVLAFWVVCGAALAKRFGAPFEQLIYLLAAAMLVLHVLQLWLFSAPLAGRPTPWRDRLQVLIFGIFHLYPLNTTKPSVTAGPVTIKEAAHA